MAQSTFKFGRNYALSIMKSESSVLQSLDPSSPLSYLSFGLPFTIEFDVQRNSYTSANSAMIRIYNLSEDHRRFLAHDEYNFGSYQRVVLKAGYGDGPEFPTIFRGNVTKCQSVREGVNFVTIIEALDGGFAQNNAVFNNAFEGNTPRSVVLGAMMSSLSQFHVDPGALGDYSTIANPMRGNAYGGNTFQLLSDLTGNGVFIDNELVNCIQDGEYIFYTDIPLVTAESGLLGTPVRQQSFLTFNILFEPRIGIGKVIELKSSTGFNYDGFFKVASVQHKGTISETTCGELVTSVGVPYVSGFTALSPVQAL